VITIEEGKEAGLGARGAFDATETQVVPRALDVPQVPKEFLRYNKYPVPPCLN
jgi:hypothetical protein